MVRYVSTILAIAATFVLVCGCAGNQAQQKRIDELSTQVIELQGTLADMNLRLEEMNSSLFVLRESARNNRESIKKLQQNMQAPTVIIDQPPAPVAQYTPPVDIDSPMAPLPLPVGSGQPSADDQAGFEAAIQQAQKQNWGLAIYDLNAFVTQHPKSAYLPRARYELGEAYRNLGEHAQAVREYERCLAAGEMAGPYAPRALFWIAVSLQRLGQNAKAKQAQQRLMQEYPNSPEAKKIALEAPR